MLTIENIGSITDRINHSNVVTSAVQIKDDCYIILFYLKGHRNKWYELKLSRAPNIDETYNVSCGLWQDKISKSELLSPDKLAGVVNTIAEMMPNI
jgi:hypothetical protein